MKESDATRPEFRELDPSEHHPQESQALCQLLLDQLPVGVFQKDREGRYVFVNASFCRLQEAAAEDFLGKTALEVNDCLAARTDGGQSRTYRLTKFLKQGADHHALIMETGQTIEVEEHDANADGSERYFHAIKGPLTGRDGAIIGSQGILLDITARRMAEVQLAREQDLTRALLNSSTDMIYFKDRQSRFLRCSAALGPLFRVSSTDEIIGKTDFDFHGAEHARAAFEDEQEIIRSGQPMLDKTEKEAWADGRVSWALTSKWPLRDRQGEIIGTFGISKIITALKETEAKVEQLHSQLLRTSREAGMAEVATSILHNVGNVLNSVNVSATLLLEGAKKSKISSLSMAVALLNEHASDLGTFLSDDPKGKQFPAYLRLLYEQLSAEQQQTVTELESVHEHIEHVKEIVAMQQNYAKVSGVTEIVKATDLVDDALRMNTGSLARHEVTLIREYTDDSTVNLDKHKVLQILVNLIRNAKSACDESGRKDKQIKMSISTGGQGIKIAVIDNGIGISPENLTRIFSHGFTTRKEGHGFGLHSASLAAKELGGSLEVYSKGPGLGATFTLALPIQPPADVRDTAHRNRRRDGIPAG